MKQTLWAAGLACVAATLMIAQAPAGGQGKGKAGKAAAKAAPAQSPASPPRPQTLTEQQYPADQVQAGEQKFAAQCGFCHGRDTTGGETGPDLTRSDIVAEDTRGDKLGPFLKEGRPDEGMPGFTLSASDLSALVAFIHTQKTKFDAVGGGRRGVEESDLATGNADRGRAYFNGAGGCAACHSPTGDLAGVGTRFRGLALIQRMLYPTNGRPAPARPKATITLASGQVVTGPVAVDDEFTLTITDAAGNRQSYDKATVQYKVDDPISAHFDQLGKYTDATMHDVYAFLATLK